MPNAIATDFFLAQNYPNPWNPSTIIKYGLPTRTFVRLTVFNTLGQLVASLADEIQEAGIHEQEFRGDNLASGVYFCRLEAGGFLAVRRLVFLK
jgi:hypothetical protein